MTQQYESVLFNRDPSTPPHSYVVHLPKSLDIQRLLYALTQLVQTQSLLRASFTYVEGELKYRIRQFAPFIEVVHEARALSDLNFEVDLEHNAFDTTIPTTAPLFAFKIICLTDCMLLQFNVSPLIFDEASMPIFLSQLSHYYENPFQSITLTPSFSELIQQMHQLRRLPSFKMQLQQWQSQQVVQDTYHAYMPVQSLTNENHTQWQTVKIQHDKVNLDDIYSSIILANHFIGRSDDVHVGLTTMRTPSFDQGDAIGPRIRILPGNFHVDRTLSYQQFKTRLSSQINTIVNEEVLHLTDLIEAHTGFPFETLIHSEPIHYTFEIAGEVCKAERLKPIETEAALDVYVQEVEDGYVVKMLYNRDQYDDLTIETYANLIRHLCLQGATRPEVPMNSFSLMTTAQDEAILQQLLRTESDIFATVPELFAEQVQRHPDKVAVRFENDSITYAQLDRLTNQVARQIRARGVKPNDYIAVMAERSMEMIVAVLGIVKSGAAYVPIDPDYPEARIQYILEDVQPALFVLHQVDFDTTAPTVLLKDLQVGSDATVPVVNHCDDDVYVIYTSGTTGQPKGTRIMHQSVDRLVKGVDYVPLNEATKILLSGTIAFDAVTFEIYGALLNGGELVVLSKDQLLNPKALEQAIQKYEINTMWLTASLFNATVSTHVEALEPLSYLLVGGEALTRKWVELLHQRPHHPQIINGYGPTESTTFTTTYTMPETIPARIPIGKPIRETDIYILQGTQRCGIGVPGELCIGGAGLAKGYLNRPELTASRFIDHPFGTGKLYRTGDLVRLQPDGEIDYLGRLDKQVKIRGFRIELTEIERAIERIHGVNKAVVVTREVEGDKQLYAFYEGEQEISNQTMTTTLSAQMPSYMVPLSFQRIDQIPMTVNGKLNTQALPDPETRLQSHYEAPRNEMEQVLCHIFEEVLHIERVDIHDHFFELGGHSLKATLVVNRIEREWHKPMTVADLMKYPTVASLSERLEGMSESQTETMPIVTSNQQAYPASAAQRGMYFLWQLDPDDTVYNVPFIWRLSAPLDIEKLRHAVSQLIERHEILRTQFGMDNQQVYQYIQDCHIPDFEVVTLEEHDPQVLVECMMQPFDLENDRLLRIRYIQTPEDDFLFMDTHHSVNDGMSQTIILDELNQLYQDKPLPTTTHQYKDYSAWSNQREMTNHQTYWHELLKETPPTLELPLDYPRPHVKSTKGEMYQWQLDEDLSQKIKQYVQQHDVTDFMFFMSVIMVLLSQYSRQEEIVLGSVMSARTHPDTERMLGMFANSVVFKGQPTRNKPWLTFLDEMKTMSLAAYAHQDYPFSVLVDDLIAQRDASRHPFFDVIVIRQNNEAHHAHFGHSRLIHQHPKSTTAKFDLSFIIEEDNHQFAWNIEYRTDLFHKETIQHMCDQFEVMIQAILDRTALRIGELPIAKLDMHQWVEAHVTPQPMAYPEQETVGNRIKQLALQAPEATAMIFGNQHHSMQMLYQRALAIARHLYEQGCRKGDRVALLMTRGPEMIESMIAAALLGCPYVPIDTDYPKTRIEFILKDAQVKHILTNVPPRFTTAATLDVRSCVTQEDDAQVIQSSEHVEANDVLYMIYTSGTTGQPKGVQITHHNVMNLVTGWSQNIKLTSDDVILQYANIVFDASVMEIYCALFNSCPLVIASEQERKDIFALEQCLRTQHVTVALIPAQLCMMMTDYHLRCLITGGSVSTPELVERVRPHCEMYANAYGPTESTVITTAWIDDGQSALQRVPIGRPLPNIQVYIVSEGRLCGVGIPGELCIAGDSLAKGYLNRPEVNAQAFIPNPWGDGQLYRTGDLARYLNNGEIEFLGRIDQQEKINGYRIELEEITNQMNRVDGILDSVVKVDRTHEHAQLVGYYVAEKDQSDALRYALTAQLPQYMVPQIFIRLEELPLTPNGKLDVKALPDVHSQLDRAVTMPRNQTEQQLVDVFEQVLNVTPIGIDNDFFELGGNSIATMKVVMLLKNKGIDMDMQDIYQYKTIRALVAQNEPTQLDVPGNIDVLQTMIATNQTPLSEVSQQSLGTVLLTGATGFLGAYLLYELTERYQRVHCLIRAESELQARERLIDNLSYYFDSSTREKMMRNVDIIHGDTNQDFTQLATSIDTIIHAAARTDHFGEDDEFYEANVKSTVDLIALAKRAQAQLIYISTLSVAGDFSEEQEDTQFSETTIFKDQRITSPYARSKFYAELEVLEAMRQGLKVKIMRVGNLTSSRHGNITMKNMRTNRFSIVMHDLLQLDKIGISAAQTPISFSFVDEAAQMIIQFAEIQQSTYNTFHITNHHEYTMQSMLEKLTNRTIKVVDDATFEQYVHDAGYYAWVGLMHHDDKLKPAIITQDFTLSVMKELDLSWSELSEAWLARWQQRLNDTFK
ncbi:amino acid adenylation domain-containing protein [Staphylococcus ursi]|nr:amino acid adenylation domain-containing protein [Staphylococcus sp. MI 10-1553]